MVSLFPHQKTALEMTSSQNRVAIKGYEGIYEIDACGNIYCVLSDRYHKPRQIKCSNEGVGYLRVGLYDKNHKRKKHYVHRLVAEAFIPNPENKPEVNHIDGNKHNNSVDNLEWCTSSENQKHACREHLQIPKYKLSAAQADEIRKLYVPKSKEFGTVALAKKFNVSQGTIYKIVKGLTYKEGDNYVEN